MPADACPRDLEAETGAFARSLRGEERIENAEPVLGRDARAIIDHAYDDGTAFRLDRDRDMTRETHGIERIVDQIHPHLIQLAADRMYARQTGRHIDSDADRLRARFVAQD